MGKKPVHAKVIGTPDFAEFIGDFFIVSTRAYIMTALVNGYAWNVVVLLQCALFVAYGVRLSGFLIVRELKDGKALEKIARYVPSLSMKELKELEIEVTRLA